MSENWQLGLKAIDYQYKKRKKLVAVNKYQLPIIALALLPALAFCTLISAFCVRFRFEVIDMMLYGSRMLTLQLIQQWFVVVLAVVWGFFLFVAVRSIRVSGNIVGSFGRINRELDRTIRAEIRQPLKAREYDDLTKDLLERINILIDNLPDGPLKIR